MGPGSPNLRVPLPLGKLLARHIEQFHVLPCELNITINYSSLNNPVLSTAGSCGRSQLGSTRWILWRNTLRMCLQSSGLFRGKLRVSESMMQWWWSPTHWTRTWSTLREIVKDRGARCAAVQGVAKSWTWLSDYRTRVSERTRGRCNFLQGSNKARHSQPHWVPPVRILLSVGEFPELLRGLDATVSQLPQWVPVWYQAPLSMEFSSKNTGVGFHFPPPGDLPNPGIEPGSPVSPASQADSLPPEPSGKPPKMLV